MERLLSITGEDLLTVDRKYRDGWPGSCLPGSWCCPTSCPGSSDSSGAIANRLLILQMTNSYLGREDRTLDQRLHAELPGILIVGARQPGPAHPHRQIHCAGFIR